MTAKAFLLQVDQGGIEEDSAEKNKSQNLIGSDGTLGTRENVQVETELEFPN